MDMPNTSASSKTQGFGYVGNGETTINIAAFTLAGGAYSSVFTGTIAAGVDDAASLSQVRFNGVTNPSVNGKWVLVQSDMSFRNNSPNGYDVVITIQRTGSLQAIKVQMHNTAVAASNIPAISVNIKTYFYDAPW